jgi:hypothetical protein
MTGGIVLDRIAAARHVDGARSAWARVAAITPPVETLKGVTWQRRRSPGGRQAFRAPRSAAVDGEEKEAARGREQFAPGRCGIWLGRDYPLPAERAEANRARRVACARVDEQADPFERERAAVHG